jgi:hypothetical protein
MEFVAAWIVVVAACGTGMAIGSWRERRRQYRRSLEEQLDQYNSLKSKALPAGRSFLHARSCEGDRHK